MLLKRLIDSDRPEKIITSVVLGFTLHGSHRAVQSPIPGLIEIDARFRRKILSDWMSDGFIEAKRVYVALLNVCIA